MIEDFPISVKTVTAQRIDVDVDVDENYEELGLHRQCRVQLLHHRNKKIKLKKNKYQNM